MFLSSVFSQEENLRDSISAQGQPFATLELRTTSFGRKAGTSLAAYLQTPENIKMLVEF